MSAPPSHLRLPPWLQAGALAAILLSPPRVPAEPVAAVPLERRIEPAKVDWQATIEGEGQFRSEGSNFVTRLALPVLHQRTASTVVQVAAAKGEESFGTVSAGAIQRFRPEGGNWVFGFYGFYEAKQTADEFGFQQAAMGVEVSRGRHIVRANGWAPFTGGESWKGRNGDRMTISPTAGFDVEYEVELPSPGLGLQPRLAAGYYYFTATDGVSAKESGVKLRGELQYRWVTAGVEWRDDDRGHGGNWLGLVRVSVPLGGTAEAKDKPAERMTAPIRRDQWPSTLETHKMAPARKIQKDRWSAPYHHTPTHEENCCDGAPEVIIYD